MKRNNKKSLKQKIEIIDDLMFVIYEIIGVITIISMFALLIAILVVF